MKKRFLRKYRYYVNILLVIILFMFFTKISPLVLFDSDDWINISNYRLPIPIMGAWNPSRVFPEFLMSSVGWVSAFVTNYFIKDYFLSITYTSAIVVSIFIVVLCERVRVFF